MKSRTERMKIYEEANIAKEEIPQVMELRRNIEGISLETAVQLYNHYQGNINRAIARFVSLADPKNVLTLRESWQ